MPKRPCATRPCSGRRAERSKEPLTRPIFWPRGWHQNAMASSSSLDYAQEQSVLLPARQLVWQSHVRSTPAERQAGPRLWHKADGSGEDRQPYRDRASAASPPVACRRRQCCNQWLWRPSHHHDPANATPNGGRPSPRLCRSSPGPGLARRPQHGGWRRGRWWRSGL